MIITNISKQKRKGRYNIFANDEFYSGLDEETIIKAGLKVGLEISKEQLEELVVESETRSAFNKIAGLISRQMYSERDLKNKLYKYGYGEKSVCGAIEKAKEYGYISDMAFAKSFVESKPLKSKLELKNALFQKGICSKYSADAVGTISDKDEQNRAEILAEKYLKNKELCDKTYANLYAFLARKGFNTDTIKSTLRKFKFDKDF